METREINGEGLTASRIGLGTWAIGGWKWGGTDEAESVRTIQSAPDRGVTLIDTAPVYGMGRSEEIVGKAVDEGRIRDQVVLATKCALQWDDDGGVQRNATKQRIFKEVDDSLRRLRTDVIDVLQIHWPDPLVDPRETAEAMAEDQEGRQDPRDRRVEFFARSDGCVLRGRPDRRGAEPL